MSGSLKSVSVTSGLLDIQLTDDAKENMARGGGWFLIGKDLEISMNGQPLKLGPSDSLTITIAPKERIKVDLHLSS